MGKTGRDGAPAHRHRDQKSRVTPDSKVNKVKTSLEDCETTVTVLSHVRHSSTCKADRRVDSYE